MKKILLISALLSLGFIAYALAVLQISPDGVNVPEITTPLDVSLILLVAITAADFLFFSWYFIKGKHHVNI